MASITDLRQIPKIIAIGRNYVAHAKELNNAVPKTPMFFLKPFSSVIYDKQTIRIPKNIGEVHHEVELGVFIGGEGGSNIPAKDWHKHVTAYVCALDMTARDLQEKAKKAGHPWTHAKGYDTFTPMSMMVDARSIADPHNLEIWCKVDGQLRQRSSTANMIFRIPTIIEYVSSVMTLHPGDIILTGTPAGVGPVFPGQVIEAGISNIVDMRLKVSE